MQVEKLKYTIWAADAERAANFYQTCFGGAIVRQNPHITGRVTQTEPEHVLVWTV
ncbi:MAG: VOC family protein [Opitutales bacterium]|nr:VOC family protein [Opitutales bacterium]MDP4645359.1 VOC family protein [Opitutales bacterium]MDP4777396.1 VOC family protein [Opitutales bacterium]MDP4883459.1 VOC family protein [Opitutales bacterium]MDP5080261.1 VOC family protein [Opitutales bacterium]